MNYKSIITMVIVFFITIATCISQDFKQANNGFREIYLSQPSKTNNYRAQFIKKSISGDSYDFIQLSTMIDALQAMYTVTRDSYYLQENRSLVTNVIAAAKKSSSIPANRYKWKDNFLSWTSKNKNNGYNQESLVFEGYLFKYIVKFLYLEQQAGRASSKDYAKMLRFVEDNVWSKWVSRSEKIYGNKYDYFLNLRTHIGAQWASTALVLNKISSNETIKKQTLELRNTFDGMLKGNFTPQGASRALSWNQTWNNKTKGNAKSKSKSELIQDVSHGNHIVEYLVSAYEFGNKNWTKEDLLGLCNTLKFSIYDSKTGTFRDNLDQSVKRNNQVPGTFQSDGWVKLGRMDSEVQQIYSKYLKEKPSLTRTHNQKPQFYANWVLNDFLRSKGGKY